MDNHKYIGLQNHIKNLKNNVSSQQSKTKKSALILLFFLFINTVSIAQINGCTDALANNFSSNATVNNGSCTYNTSTCTINSSVVLDTKLKETSGLMEWNGYLYTHNDGQDTNLYKLDKTTGTILKTIPLTGVQNVDWEEIAQDDSYIYIGDFGNNYSGNRTDLKIYKILKSTLETIPQIEIINFSYANQANFTAQANNKTDFDCEAFVVTSTEILLFTKQWLTEKTSVYSLSKNAGTYVATLQTTLNVSGLITGATLKENLKIITLCGHSNTLQPLLYLIYDYKDDSFAKANKRKIDIPLPYHQIEGISTSDGITYNLTNESFTFFNNTTPQQLHQLSLATYLGNYINTLSLNNNLTKNNNPILFPNPAGNEIHFSTLDVENNDYEIINLNGKTIKKGQINNQSIRITDLNKGMYLLKFSDTLPVYKFIKK